MSPKKLSLILLVLLVGAASAQKPFLECPSKNRDVMHFLKPALANMDTLTPSGSGLTLDPPKNSIGPGTELTVVIRGLDPLDGSTFMIQARDKRDERLVGEFLEDSTDSGVQLYDCKGKGKNDTASNTDDTKREFRIRWKAPSSGPPGTYNFVWQVKGPRQTGEYAWATQYKVVRDLDLQFTTSPLTSGQAKLSTSLVSVMPVATVALKLFA